MVDDEAVDFAITVIERSELATRLEDALHKTTGRKRSVTVLAVLVALLVLALDDRPLLLTSVTDILHRRLSQRARARLSITGTAADTKAFLARYRCVRYCFHAICSVVDPPRSPRTAASATTSWPKHPPR